LARIVDNEPRSDGSEVILMTAVYDEIVDFIAAGTTPERVIAFQPSEATKEWVAELLHREKTEGLAPDEAAELNRYLEYEHLMRLAKARARKLLAGGAA
jgi:hypothetical protein